jgi:hypothetical protein
MKIMEYAKLLGLERSTDNIRLNLNELTLQFTSMAGRQDHLWEIGSGQNWVGYHIATMLALHEWFLSLPNSHVAPFLVIDQPSQVYFPEAWPNSETPPTGGTPHETAKLSKDIQGVQRIMQALGTSVEKSKASLQIIVTEHAGQITWSGVPNVTIIGNWRDGRDEFLIPSSWTGP